MRPLVPFLLFLSVLTNGCAAALVQAVGTATCGNDQECRNNVGRTSAAVAAAEVSTALSAAAHLHEGADDPPVVASAGSESTPEYRIARLPRELAVDEAMAQAERIGCAPTGGTFASIDEVYVRVDVLGCAWRRSYNCVAARDRFICSPRSEP